MEIQLVREREGENDNKRDRWVDLYVGADGSARLSRHDLRPSLKEDYEYHVNVPAAAVPKLVFALLREKYLGRSDAVQEFREFCEKEGIELWWWRGVIKSGTWKSDVIGSLTWWIEIGSEQRLSIAYGIISIIPRSN
jgi:hypothetical protein